jgi:hypothetical protein
MGRQTEAVRVEPVSPEVMRDRLVERVLTAARTADVIGGHARIVIDGAPPLGPGTLADSLVGPLRTAGRPTIRVSAGDFLRPPGVRFEFGREDPDALLDTALDDGALIREVLDPLGPAGDGRYLPALWDAVQERSARASRLAAPAGAVLLLDGGLLLGRWLPVDLSVHLAVRPTTLERLTAPGDQWRLVAERRYAHEVGPESTADVVVRVDDPRHPGWVVER